MHYHSNIILDKKKYYISFYTNEGDTPKILAALFALTWLSPKRGSVPVSWGIDPYIGEVCPALVEFYANTATFNDTFFAGCSGAGYSYPFHMPNFVNYAKHVGNALKLVGPNTVVKKNYLIPTKIYKLK